MTDEWSGLADFFANMIEKYADVLDIDNLHIPEDCKEKFGIQENSSEYSAKAIVKNDVA